MHDARIASVAKRRRRKLSAKGWFRGARLARAGAVAVAMLAAWGASPAVGGGYRASGVVSGPPNSPGPDTVSGTNTGGQTLYYVSVQPGNGLTVMGGSCTTPSGGTAMPGGNGSGSFECNYPSGIAPGGTYSMMVTWSGNNACFPTMVAVAGMSPPYSTQMFPWGGGSCAGPTPPGATGPSQFSVADEKAISDFLNAAGGPLTSFGDAIDLDFPLANTSGAPLAFKMQAVVLATGILFPLPASSQRSVTTPVGRATKKKRVKKVLIASAQGTVPAGKSVKVRLKLSKNGRALLTQRKRLTVMLSLTITTQSGFHKTFTKQNAKIKSGKKK